MGSGKEVWGMLSSERTRLFHKYLVLLITAALVGFVIAAPLSRVTAFAADQENQPSLEAISALLVDARRGQVIYSKDADEHVKTPLANKLLAALIALEKSA